MFAYFKLLMPSIFFFMSLADSVFADKKSYEVDKIFEEFKSIERDTYDFSLGLIIPVIHLFKTNDKGATKKIKNIESFLIKLISDKKNIQQFDRLPQQTQALFLNLVSLFLVMMSEDSKPVTNIQLKDFVIKKLNELSKKPAFQYEHCQKKIIGLNFHPLVYRGYRKISNYDFHHLMKNKINRKFYSHIKSRESYCNLINDFEIYFLCTAANIYSLQTLSKKEKKQLTPYISIIKDLVNKSFYKKKVKDSWYYFFQLGVDHDHPDFAYAGHKKSGYQLKEKKINLISEDISHASKWPYVFFSFSKVLDDSELKKINQYRQDYKELIEKHVIYNSPSPKEKTCYILTNYLDGSNGLFRFNYQTNRKKNQGYGPYSLSGAIFFGFYSLLPKSSIISNLYKDTEKLLKNNSTKECFMGLSMSVREVNPVFKQGFSNGLFEYMCMISSELSELGVY